MSVLSFLDSDSYEIPLREGLDKMYSYTVNICLLVYLLRYNESL
jgi:hypothetical protein